MDEMRVVTPDREKMFNLDTLTQIAYNKYRDKKLATHPHLTVSQFENLDELTREAWFAAIEKVMFLLTE